MRQQSASLAGLVGLLMLAGCGGSGDHGAAGVPAAAPPAPAATPPPSAWTKSGSHSAFDGDILAVKREFVSTDKSSLIRAMLSCAATKKRLTVALESYSEDGSPSPFVSKIAAGSNGVVKLVQGRIKLGAQEPEELASLFVLDKYNNVITWDLRQFATDFAVANALAANIKRQNPGKSPKDIEAEVAGKLPSVLAIFQMSERMFAGGLPESERANIYDGTLGAGFYASIGTGNALSQSLPVDVEVNNTHGTMEIEIPANDANVTDVIQLCSVAMVAPAAAAAGETSANGSAEAPRAAAPESNTPADDGVAAVANSPTQLSLPTAPGMGSPLRADSPSASGSPSFDCTKASSKVETMICSDPAIANADFEMAMLYRRNLSAAGANAENIRKGQREFIAKRNLCTDPVCVKAAYKERTADLVRLGYVTP
jgi:hypothetical protein